MGTVIQLRRDVLPENIFRMIEDFMLGDVIALHVIAVTKDGEVINTSAGEIPGYIKNNDSLKKHG